MTPDERDVAGAIAKDLVERGTRRIILLGVYEPAGDQGLKRALARRGLMVLTPPPAARPWLDGVLIQAAAGTEMDPETSQRFAAFLADGLEHGVDAVIVMNEGVHAFIESCDLGVTCLNACDYAS